MNDDSAFTLSPNGQPAVMDPPAVDEPESPRRADIDAKQAVLAGILTEMGCEGAILLVPAHLAWFAGGMNVRGLFADSERPGVYTNGRMRWLLCGNADTQRLFDEELDGLGFMLKEWQWSTGRAQLLSELVAGKKIASDRPIPGLPQLLEKLRPQLRPLYPSDRRQQIDLGGVVAHALEATARGLSRGDTEQEIAGQLAHRALHHGAEVYSLSVTADVRGKKFRRSGFTDTRVETYCTLQLTASRNGLHATAARAVSFGPPPDEFRVAHDTACKLSAVFRSMSKPDETITSAVDAGARLLKHTDYEHEWRLSTPVYGTGWSAADELRKAGQDEPFVDRQPLVWQAGSAPRRWVDTVIVTPDGADPVTPPENWPYKRITVGGKPFVVPDVLVRSL